MLFDVNAWLGTWPFRSLKAGTPAALVERMDRAGIQAAAVSSIEASFHRNVQPANERLIESTEAYKERLIPLATLNPSYSAWEDDLNTCHEEFEMKGVRLTPQYHGYAVDGPECVRAVKACAERGLPVSIPHRLEDPRQRHWMDPGQTITGDQVGALLDKVPEATVLITNARGVVGSALCRKPELWNRNWFVDTSLAGVHYQLGGKGEFLRLLQEKGGADHLVFGTHLPFSYAGSALVKMAVLPVDDEIRESIGWQKAASLYGVEVKVG